MSQPDDLYDPQKYPFNPTATGFTPNNALCLAAASELAYVKDETVRTAKLIQWGFTQSRMVDINKKPFVDTQAFVCSNSNTLLIAFRGTEPTDLQDWLTNVRFDLTEGPIRNIQNKVHRGFMEALDSAWPQLAAAITALRTSDQAIWVTGHSLGAALATLAAARFSLGDGIGNRQIDVQGLYTFGQPRTGNRGFVKAFDQRFQGRSFRFVNNNDIVPEVPPMGFVLKYWHIDRLIYINASGRLRPEISLAYRIIDGIKGLTKDLGKLGADALKDHSMNNYVRAIRRYLDDLATGKQAPIR